MKDKINLNKCACEQWEHFSSVKVGNKIQESAITKPYNGSGAFGVFYLDYNNGIFCIVAENDECYIDMPITYCPCCGKKLNWNQIMGREI